MVVYTAYVIVCVMPYLWTTITGYLQVSEVVHYLLDIHNDNKLKFRHLNGTRP